MHAYFINTKTIEKLIMETDLTKYTNLTVLARMYRASNEEKKKHIFGSDVLLKYVLFENEIPISSKITYNFYGKPFINEGYYNISHSNKWIMCVFHSTNIGVDIEKTTHVNLELAKYFFTQPEYDYLKQITPERKIEFFFNTWTFKESYVKNRGISLFSIKNKFDAPRNINYFVKQDISINGFNFNYFRGFMDGYKWCIFSSELPSRISLEIVEYKGLEKVLPEIGLC
jgi:phosphopantetheinyl transferase